MILDIKVLYEKGDRSNGNIFRGISPLPHVGKVAKVITNRLSAFCEANDILPEEQRGFRPGRSTVCMLFVVRCLQELARRMRIPMYMCSVDLHNAYDSVDRQLVAVERTGQGSCARGSSCCHPPIPRRDAGPGAHG